MSELLDNRRYRLDRLKDIIRRLHDGEDPARLKASFGELLSEVGPTEIASLEDELMTEGMPQQEVQRMCDVHALLLAGDTPGADDLGVPPGHPADTLRAENDEIRERVERYRRAVTRATEKTEPSAVAALRAGHADLRPVEHHYQRKELLVFPYLERAGIVGPPKVMWGVDDEIRERLRAADDVLDGADQLVRDELELALETVINPMLDQVASMTEKENNVLIPMALDHIAETEWGKIAEGWEEIGPMIVPPAERWRPMLPVFPAHPAPVAPSDAIRLPSGHLTLQQLTAMLDTLPVDITFVDADDRVAYFSEGPDRVFARSRTVIGRKVQNCHPPKSLHIVQRIVNELRSGERDVAEFWIRLHGRFVHIRYVAVRAEDGEYLGTLEMTQDATRVRGLEGERRLLDEPSEAAS